MQEIYFCDNAFKCSFLRDECQVQTLKIVLFFLAFVVKTYSFIGTDF